MVLILPDFYLVGRDFSVIAQVNRTERGGSRSPFLYAFDVLELDGEDVARIPGTASNRAVKDQCQRSAVDYSV